MADLLSQCPHQACRAKGVRIDDHLMIDGLNVGGTYCGHCGRTWPYEAVMKDNARRMAQRVTQSQTAEGR